MHIPILDHDDTPIYQQIVDAVTRDIHSGVLPPGSKLPTVRELADSAGISRGTVKHAYDCLEYLGLVEMTQGRGTFVCGRSCGAHASKRDLALEAVDHMVDDVLSLSFSLSDIRLLFDQKMREREERPPYVRIAVVDCNPEALSAIAHQLSLLPNVQTCHFLLDDVLEHPERLHSQADLIVTTATHFGDLEYRAPGGIPLMQLVLSVSSGTVLQLARLDPGCRVGIVTASNKYASIIQQGCAKFSVLNHEPETYLLGSGGLEEFAAGKDVLVVPLNYYKFCGRREEEALGIFTARDKLLICHEYHIDRGSFLYVGEEIQRIYTQRA